MRPKLRGGGAAGKLSGAHAGLLACLLTGLTACDRPAGVTASASGPVDPVPKVRVVRPVRQEVVRKITLPGTVRADLEVTLYSKVTGYVKTITKDRGDRVKAGEVIAKLEIPEMSLDLDHARASFALEDTTLARLEAIRKLERSAVTDQDLDLARAKRAMAQASLRRLETMLSYTEIHVPFDGHVTERFVDPGALVQQGKVVSIVDTSTVRILVDVPESEVRFVHVGTPGEIHLDALAGKALQANVARVTTSLDPSTRTMRVELDLPNPHRTVLPGMFARVVLDLERRPDALVVPSKAVVFHQERPFVFVNAGGKVKKLELTVGIANGTWTEAVAGLTGEESVILPGVQGLAEGMQVQPTEGS